MVPFCSGIGAKGTIFYSSILGIFTQKSYNNYILHFWLLNTIINITSFAT